MVEYRLYIDCTREGSDEPSRSYSIPNITRSIILLVSISISLGASDYLIDRHGNSIDNPTSAWIDVTILVVLGLALSFSIGGGGGFCIDTHSLTIVFGSFRMVIMEAVSCLA